MVKFLNANKNRETYAVHEITVSLFKVNNGKNMYDKLKSKLWKIYYLVRALKLFL